MCFMFCNSRSVYEFHQKQSRSKPSDWNQIWPMKSDPSRLWIKRNVLLEDVLSSPIRCNGAITQKKKPHGNQRTIYELTTQSFSLPTEEEIYTYSVWISSPSEEEICTYSVKDMLCNFWKNKGLIPNVEQPSLILEQSRFSKSQFVETHLEKNLKRRLSCPEYGCSRN